MQMRSVNPRPSYLERGAAALSLEAQKRLRWFDHYQAHGRNAAVTSRHFGMRRKKFYRCERAYTPGNLDTLEWGP